ncbi:autotransporter domain-containing protein [Plesiomonas sp. ZOR0011]|uniref:autotransporter domain-containing protein n=1 Tax=Plesiomonas sp. ZOR0011 TaxID=1339230 RepID=UPI0009DDEF7F|nr:autotransporter domain-containing protein [Plesiomonas sp. ZOR0011]
MIFKKKICATFISSILLASQAVHANSKTENIYDILNEDGIVVAGAFGQSNVLALSDSGNTALGFSAPSMYAPSTDVVATVWDSKKGMISLPKYSGYSGLSAARSISGDHQSIVGYLSRETGGERAVYWDNQYNIHLLDNLSSNEHASSAAFDISRDGNIIVGHATTDSNLESAVYWTKHDNKVHALNMPGDYSSASAVNGNGTMIVGKTNIGSSDIKHAFRWTDKGGVELLPSLSRDHSTTANGLSDTGRVIGTAETSPTTLRAVYWDTDNQIHDLGTLGKDNQGSSQTIGISRLGTVISGSSSTDDGKRLGFIWKEGVGMRSVNQWLTDAHVDAGTMIASSVNAMSSDGATIAGQLADGSGYVARVVTIKEPPIVKPEEPKPEPPIVKPEEPKPEPPTVKPDEPKPQPPSVKPDEPTPDGGSGIVNVDQVNQSLSYVQQSMELQRQATVQAADNADCATFGPNGMCVKVNADVRNRNDDIGEYTNPSATITIAKQLQEHGRAGLSVTELHSHIKNDIGTKIEQTAPIFTAFVGYGNDTDLGWKGYAGISVLNAPVDIDRAYYNGADKEWGYGKTRARSLNYQVRGGYTFQPNSRYQVTPFVALNYNDTKWNGYQETGDGAFLAAFSNQRSRVSTLHIGVDNQYQIDDKNSMGMTLGLRKNLHTNNSTGNAIVLDGFGGLATQYQVAKVSKVLPELEANYSYTLDKNQKVTLYSGYRDVGFGAGEVNGGISYRINF